MEFSKFLETTISWCANKIDATNPRECLRSKELQAVVEEAGEDPSAIWNSSKLISSVLQKRNELSKTTFQQRQNGRVLLCAYDYTNHNALTDFETNGYIDEHDNPPWDTWICEIHCEGGGSSKIDYGESWPPNIGSILGDGDPFHFVLAAWVPEEFEPLVQKAIEVECVGMLFWADSIYPESSIAPKYNEVLPKWFQGMYVKNS